MVNTFSRYILQSSSMTSKPALIGELGLMSLYGRRNYKKLSYWFHIINLPDSSLLKYVYLESKRQSNTKQNWCRRIKKVFDLYNLQHIWNDNKLVFNLDGTIL